MNECHAVALDSEGYQFTQSEKGDIHLAEITEVVGDPAVQLEESYPAKDVINHMDIKDYFIKSPMGGTGEIGLHIGELDRFLDGADRSPYSITVDEEVRGYIEEEY